MASNDTSTPICVSEVPIAPYVPGPPRSRFARKYLEVTGDALRAQRLDQCGRFRDLRDKNKHTKREFRHCMDPWCRTCIVTLNRNTFLRWQDTLRMMACPDMNITFVEASIPQAIRTREAVDFALEDIEDKFYDALIRDNISINPHWQASPGYKGLNVISRVLIFQSQYSTEQLVAMFPPNATIKVQTYSADKLCDVFRSKLLAVELDDDPEDRAEQAALLGGMRRFRAHGAHCGVSVEENELFADTELSANISPEQLKDLETTPIPAGPIPHNICGCCGEEFDEESQWFPPDSIEPRPGEHRWYSRYRSKPPN